MRKQANRSWILAVLVLGLGLVGPVLAQDGDILPSDVEDTSPAAAGPVNPVTGGDSGAGATAASSDDQEIAAPAGDQGTGAPASGRADAAPAADRQPRHAVKNQVSLSAATGTVKKITKTMIGEQIGQVAASFPTKYKRKGSFPYAKGTQNGNLGCANVVSAALRAAGIRIPIILGVDGVKSKLQQMGWKARRPPPFKPGDVIVWARRGKHKHIGIIARKGNALMAMNNSSSGRRPDWSSPTYRAVECVMRLE
ncbi:MAG: hypothetical protein GX442_14795 [Candidatus Riflebacteria bacterium]|nr:hypothetical protein [Candidatus Riflebacteria bacterium]